VFIVPETTSDIIESGRVSVHKRMLLGSPSDKNQENQALIILKC
jgi:hypothetical protein